MFDTDYGRPAGLAVLWAVLRESSCDRLRAVNVSRNPFGDAGAAVIAEASDPLPYVPNVVRLTETFKHFLCQCNVFLQMFG